MANHPGAAHTVRMHNVNRSTVDVIALWIDPEPVATEESLTGESLVQLPETDVIDAQAMPLEQFRYGVDGSQAHFLRCAAGNGDPSINSQWAQPASLGQG